MNQLPVNEFKSPASLVMIINGNVPIETKEWLISIMKGLLVDLSIVIQSENLKLDPNQNLTLLISCSDEILQQNAKKVYRQLSRQSSDDNKLTISEKQRILHHLIQELHCERRTIIQGLPEKTLYPGQSIIEICCKENIITDYYPLHDYTELINLRMDCINFKNFSINIDSFRNYFGEMLGFYFAFLTHYTKMFALASFIFFFGYFLQMVSLEFYTLIICFGTFVFMKLWRRYSNELALQWGTIDLFELNEARPTFRSKDMFVDEVTGKRIPFYPIFKTWLKEYFMSVPFVIFCLYVSFQLMIYYFKCEEWMAQNFDLYESYFMMALSLIPGIAYALIVMIMNHLYIYIVTKLNDYENHKTQESHENHLIVKLVLFESFNNFISLYYIAFYLQDMAMLKYSLVIMLTVNKLVENLIELFIPMYSVYKKDSRILQTKFTWKDQIEHENNLFVYEHTYWDFLELFTQFGYAFLFLAIWPSSPLVAFFNSFLEIRMDSIKLCYFNRHPFQRSMKSINNAWIRSFEVMAIIIVITNLMILALISEQFKLMTIYLQISTFELIVYIEHIFLSIVLIFWYIVPDISKQVNLKFNRQKYLQHSSNIMIDKKIN